MSLSASPGTGFLVSLAPVFVGTLILLAMRGAASTTRIGFDGAPALHLAGAAASFALAGFLDGGRGVAALASPALGIGAALLLVHGLLLTLRRERRGRETR